MRVAMVSPLEMRVPPVGYGGTEMIVSLLTEELVKQGHDVTLFASGDSVTSARLIPVSETFLRGSGRDKAILNMLNVMACLVRVDEFDIIHNHTTFEGLATAGLVNTPMLTTLHGGINGDWTLLFQHYQGWFNAISNSALSLLPPKGRSVGVVYNAIEFATYLKNTTASTTTHWSSSSSTAKWIRSTPELQLRSLSRTSPQPTMKSWPARALST